MTGKTLAKKITKPLEGEYAPYAIMYINLVPAGGLTLQQLSDTFITVKNLILSLPADKLLYRYADGKWTIKEMLVHIIDTERIFCYRALCIARYETGELPGFEQDDYARYSNANNRDIRNIMDEYEAVRYATLALFNGFDDSVFTQTGIANKNKFSVRAAAYQIAGHELHHLKIITEKYL